MDSLIFNKKHRIVYFDYLRVFATFSMMILHISAQNWYVADVKGADWQIINFYDSIVRWCVPVFVMISGALFLDKKISIRKLYSKYILRMIIAFFVWSIIYSFFAEGTIKNKIIFIIQGHYHMWFILMIIGIYMCIPILRTIIKDEETGKYYLFLALFFTCIIPYVILLINDFGNKTIIRLTNEIRGKIQIINPSIVLGFSGYFLLGYYLNKINLKKEHRLLIYYLGIIGFFSTIGLTSLSSIRKLTPYEAYYGNFTINVLFESLAVFTWFKYRKFNNEIINSLFHKLSNYSFGAYLIHALIFEQLCIHFRFNTLLFNPLFSIFYIGIIVFIFSFGISAILNHIPAIKKFIV